MERIKLFIPLGIFVVIGVFLFIGLGNDPKVLPSALEGKPLPEFELPLLQQDRSVSNKDIVGEAFLLNVWATWCPTCIHEHPFLMELAKQGITIVGLNYKDENFKAVQWLKRLGDPYRMNLVDKEGSLGLRLGVYGAPETFIVDKNGTVLFRHAGDLNARVWEKHFAHRWKAL